MSTELTADEIIDALGGTSETARLCQVRPPSVSEWRKPERGIPQARLMYLKLVRPDVFERNPNTPLARPSVSIEATPQEQHCRRQSDQQPAAEGGDDKRAGDQVM